AADAGTVTGVRDGMPDIDITADNAVDVSDRECGNGVVILHDDGWETQYCHLRKSSVQVRSGDRVRQGQKLGEVGMSGLAAFPHLEFLVRHDGAVVDPFAPGSVSGCADQNLDQLWLAPLPYVPTGVLDAGFSTEVPDYSAVKEGLTALSSLTQEASALVIWATYFGPRAGDRIHSHITGPEGFVFEDAYTVERDQAQAMRATGRRKPANGWPLGVYTAILTYVRGDALQWRIERQIQVLR
ncbi:MAG: M23 family metallopeptidase, partial [Hyphomonas sp.]|nr:M23 family metallopeptidase [Hyphomonas sp.]